MPKSDLMPNNQERASSLYYPTHPSKKALICLNCSLKTCKPKNCERYRSEVKKLKEEQKQP